MTTVSDDLVGIYDAIKENALLSKFSGGLGNDWTQYAVDTMPRGVLGLNVQMFHEYLRFVANRRLRQISLPEQYPGAKNPLPG